MESFLWVGGGGAFSGVKSCFVQVSPGEAQQWLRLWNTAYVGRVTLWRLSRTNGLVPHSLGAHVYCCGCEGPGTRRFSSPVSVSVSQGPSPMLDSGLTEEVPSLPTAQSALLPAGGMT